MRRTAIVTPRGEHVHLLVPETDAERMHGMNSGASWPFGGMIFSFDPAAHAAMTMEETPIPLRIAFLGPGQVVHTVVDAAPRSGVVRAGQRTRWVIETLRPVLQVGDVVRFVG